MLRITNPCSGSRAFVAVLLASSMLIAIPPVGAKDSGSELAPEPPATNDSHKTSDKAQSPGVGQETEAVLPAGESPKAPDAVPEAGNTDAQSQSVPPSQGEEPAAGDGASTQPVKPAKPAAPATSGKPLLALQLPTHRLLQHYLWMNQPAAIARVKTVGARATSKLTAAGFDCSIDFDKAAELGKPVLSIYLVKERTQNALGKGIKVAASLCQYTRKPNGQVVLVSFKKIGESEEIYSPGDFEDKAVMLVDAYLSALEHQRKGQVKKGKPQGPGKKRTK